MAETIRLMPCRCSRCGAVFDLQYDLRGLDSEERMMEVLFIAKTRGLKPLCWKCRE